MKDIGYNTKIHKGVIVERAGLGWRVWADYVTALHHQPTADNLAQARGVINARTAP